MAAPSPATATADTAHARHAMVDAGVGAIVVLGGDGTNGIVAEGSGDIPLVSISTGTNNAFPQPIEPTVAGLTAGIVASHDDVRTAGTYRAKKLLVECGEQRAQALVDVAITRADRVGSGAVWDVTSISELFLAFAEPENIGLSAIGGHLRPTGRRTREGLALVLGDPAETVVRAPIAPGLLTPIGVSAFNVLEPDSPATVRTGNGVIALDGERRLRFGPEAPPTVTLSSRGPVVVDVKLALDHAASCGILTTPVGAESSPNATDPARPSGRITQRPIQSKEETT